MPIKWQKAYRTKQIGPEKKLPATYDNQNIKYTGQRKDIKRFKEKTPSHT